MRIVFAALILHICICCGTNIISQSWEEEMDPDYWLNLGRNTLKQHLNKKVETNVAKNIIMFLGDGMGLSTITAGRIRAGQLRNELGESYVTNMESLPFTGLSKTYNIDHQTPDSAATATAYLCGVKTQSYTIGVSGRCPKAQCKPCLNTAVKSILYNAYLNGKSTGIVTVTRVTHATPAAAYAHVADRDWEGFDGVEFGNEQFNDGCRDIAFQLIRNNSFINVILGGGRQYFIPQEENDPEYTNMRGKRIDKLNLIDQWKKTMKKVAPNRFKYVWNKEEFDNIDASNTDYLLGLFEPSHMLFEVDRLADPNNEPSLASMVQKAIQILRKNKKGYFLFVEGGRIDHGHHGAQSTYALDDFIAFDEAIKRGMQLTNEIDTHLVVTADHSHTFAFGGYSYRNSNILGLAHEYNRTLVADDGLPYTIISYGNGPGYITTGERLNKEYWKNINLTDPYFQYHGVVPLNSETHGGEDVVIYARGPMSHLYVGTIEQNVIQHIMSYSACIHPYNTTECKLNRGEMTND